MRIKSGFALRQVVDNWIVLPVADQIVNFSAMITLNDAGALLWNTLEQGADKEALISALTTKYEVSAEQARQDVDEFIEKLINVGCVEV